MATDSDLLVRYRNALPSFLSPYYSEPIQIDHGDGSYVFDASGTRYLDFFGGVLTTMIGHNNPEVTDAVKAQASKVMHTSSLYLSEPMIELAEKIAALSGRRQRVSTERREVEYVDRVHDLCPGYNAGEREAVADALSEGQDVGHDAMGLVAPEVVAGSTPAGLDLVADEEDAVIVELLLHGTKEPVGRGSKAANTLDWLGDKRGNVASRSHRQELSEVVHAGVGEGGVVGPGEGTAQLVGALHERHLETRVRGRRPRCMTRDRLS